MIKTTADHYVILCPYPKILTPASSLLNCTPNTISTCCVKAGLQFEKVAVEMDKVAVIFIWKLAANTQDLLTFAISSNQSHWYHISYVLHQKPYGDESILFHIFKVFPILTTNFN